MKNFFTADNHFFHSNIIIYCDRPWLQDGDLASNGKWIDDKTKYKRTAEMNEQMVEEWNETVSPGDNVYIAGDFALNNDPAKIDKLVKSLNGNKYLVTGDHDSRAVKQCQEFKWVRDLSTSVRVEGIDIVLSHWAYLVWGESHYGSWNLYGHSHGKLEEFANKLSCDVGYDVWKKPVSLEEVKEKMFHKDFTPINKRKR
mgnify:CR=1 FL=1